MARGIELLHPELQALAAKFAAGCKSAGLNVLITETFRTAAEQDALYAQGRTRPGNIVTNCKGSDYQSAHQWGVAFDICRNEKGREYADGDGFFAKCGTVGKKLGLTWGGDWKGFVDTPHFELEKYLPNSSTTALKRQYGTPEAFKKTWGAFTPEKGDDDVTQEQFEQMYAAMLAKSSGDNPSQWAKGATEAAKEKGVFAGDGKGNYDWQKPVTREMLASIIQRLKLV